MHDCLAFGESGTRMNISADSGPELVHYRNQKTQFSTEMLRYRTEMMYPDATALASMPIRTQL
jgi:hypothetical protein